MVSTSVVHGVWFSAVCVVVNCGWLISRVCCVVCACMGACMCLSVFVVGYGACPGFGEGRGESLTLFSLLFLLTLQ